MDARARSALKRFCDASRRSARLLQAPCCLDGNELQGVKDSLFGPLDALWPVAPEAERQPSDRTPAAAAADSRAWLALLLDMDAISAVKALIRVAAKGFESERRDLSWLHTMHAVPTVAFSFLKDVHKHMDALNYLVRAADLASSSSSSSAPAAPPPAGSAVWIVHSTHDQLCEPAWMADAGRVLVAQRMTIAVMVEPPHLVDNVASCIGLLSSCAIVQTVRWYKLPQPAAPAQDWGAPFLPALRASGLLQVACDELCSLPPPPPYLVNDRTTGDTLFQRVASLSTFASMIVEMYGFIEATFEQQVVPLLSMPAVQRLLRLSIELWDVVCAAGLLWSRFLVPASYGRPPMPPLVQLPRLLARALEALHRLRQARCGGCSCSGDGDGRCGMQARALKSSLPLLVNVRWVLRQEQPELGVACVADGLEACAWALALASDCYVPLKEEEAASAGASKGSGIVFRRLPGRTAPADTPEATDSPQVADSRLIDLGLEDTLSQWIIVAKEWAEDWAALPPPVQSRCLGALARAGLLRSLDSALRLGLRANPDWRRRCTLLSDIEKLTSHRLFSSLLTHHLQLLGAAAEGGPHAGWDTRRDLGLFVTAAKLARGLARRLQAPPLGGSGLDASASPPAALEARYAQVACCLEAVEVTAQLAAQPILLAAADPQGEGAVSLAADAARRGVGLRPQIRQVAVLCAQVACGSTVSALDALAALSRQRAGAGAAEADAGEKPKAQGRREESASERADAGEVGLDEAVQSLGLLSLCTAAAAICFLAPSALRAGCPAADAASVLRSQFKWLKSFPAGVRPLLLEAAAAAVVPSVAADRPSLWALRPVLDMVLLLGPRVRECVSLMAQETGGGGGGEAFRRCAEEVTRRLDEWLAGTIASASTTQQPCESATIAAEAGAEARAEAGGAVPWLCGNPLCERFEGPCEAQATRKKCGGCGAVRYCCAECQLQHWRGGHKAECAAAVVAGPRVDAAAAPAADAGDRAAPEFGMGGAEPVGGRRSLEELMAMRPRELKALLAGRGVDCSDCVEKVDLARRVLERC
ncbi:hypothetical protein TSOC_010686 [Tetrabaena socialis]|uniref:MYND-type domain-containing protein n=1 Tax=Tetrabaena socialis TaxID=47790 RepID=A0A2J7ZSM5_9CHLO|nr:hypothetical protein TSOC_010686 [Tetrabaena socialis]|eukprot:PNH03269.1 hypothetical protein TSOC_010686 [Tetrabaena socialis]